jgi:hypothetical protein
MFNYILKQQKNISYLDYIMDHIINFIKGLIKMDYYFHPDFNTQKIRNFLEDIVNRKGYEDYSQLNKEDKAEFSSLLCEAAGKSDEFCCITEPKNSDETIRLFRQALIGTKEDNQKFLETIKNNAIDYYERTMTVLFHHIYHISPNLHEPDPNNWPCSYEEIRG